jgi:cytochrome P450
VSATTSTDHSLSLEIDRLLARDPTAQADRYALYQRLRDEAPVFAYDAGTVIVSRHADVKTVYRDTERFPSHENLNGKFEGRFDLLSADELALYDEWIALERTRVTRLNGEDHRRVRSAGARAFTSKRLANVRESIEVLVDRLLDELAAEKQPDFMNFAYQLPLLVILDMMGVPHEDGPKLKRWCDEIVTPGGENPLRPEAVRAAHAAEVDFRGYVRELVARQRGGQDRTSLVGALLDASSEDRLSEPELVTTYLHLLLAGHETTTNMFGNGLLALLQHRDQWKLLCADPSLASSTVEEVLRYDAPVHFIWKTTRTEQELAGVTIPGDALVVVANAAGNRDPRAFDDPDSFNITRRPNDHLSFAYGVHFCLGAGLARMEGAIGFSALARRFPKIHIAVDPTAVEYNPHFSFRNLKSLPVDLGMAS